MKIVSTSFLALLIFTQSLSASTDLKSITEQYQYSLEVEWDQQDQKVLETINSRLSHDIDKLVVAGVSHEALLNEALRSIPDSKLKNDLEAKIELLSNQKMSDEDFQELMLQSLDINQSRGASWNPAGKVIIGTAAVLAITYLALRVYMHEWGKRF
jgi:hypothetical protein